MRRFLAVTVVAAAVLLPAAPSLAVSSDVVINEVYGGGGNSGAPYRNDYIELYNSSGSAVSLAGWSVQYASATGSSWLVTNLSGSIAAGGHYLVQLASGGAVGATLPAPDATGSTNMSATAGKVALRTTTTALTCSTGCATQPSVRDFLGYGSASSYEGSPAPAASNTTADTRVTAGVDTDNNATDFAALAPTPQNSSSGGGGGGCTGYPATRIRTIQGAAHLSPLTGSQSTRGVVTAVASNGFWIQDPCPDANVATSEAVFVFTSTAPTNTVGQDVTVTGTVSEFRPGGASSTNLTVTELTGPTIAVVGTAAVPTATVVGTGGRVPPAAVIDDDATGSVETSGSFDAVTDGIDFWESLEGMRVQVVGAVATGPRTSAGQIPIIPAGSGVRTNRGGIAIQSTDFNPERVVLDDRLAATPSANVGDTFAGGSVTGVIDYGNANFTLLPSTSPVLVSGGIGPESTTAATTGQLAVATFNVENLDPGDAQSKFDALGATIVNNLKAPDLLALEEIQDNDGPTNSSTVAADQTLNKLIASITAAGGPTYTYRLINPTDDADGGEPGGNIRSVFLFRTDRGLSFTDRPGGTATNDSTVSNVGGQPQLLYSPGRIKPADTAWSASRKPLVGEFVWNGRRVFVVANHFNSKGGDDPLMGRDQPPVRSSETKRHQQATLVNTFVDQVRAIDANAAVIVLGDINDFDFSTTADLLVGAGELVDLPRTLPVAERYTYVWEGNSQVLDHILLSSWLATQPYAYDVVHVNSEFAAQISDHDPQVVRLTL